MDRFNRILIGSMVGLWIVFWLAAIIVTLFYSIPAIAVGTEFFTFLAENNSLYLQLMFAMLYAVLILLGLFALLLALTPRADGAVRLPPVVGGVAWLTAQAIAHRIQAEVEKLPEIRRAKPIVSPHGGSVDLKLELSTDPAVDPRAKTEEVCRVVRQLVEGTLRIKVGQVQVYIYHKEPPSSEKTAPTA